MRGNTFIGWIPNVAGRLSFSHIGATHFPAKCLKTNIGNGYGRRLAVAQRRKLNDWLLPDWYFKFLYGFSSDWIFVFIGESCPDKFDQIARMQGEVFVLEKSVWETMGDHKGYISLKDFYVGEFFPWVGERLTALPSGEIPPAPALYLREKSLFSYTVKIRRSGVLWLLPKHIAPDIQFSESYVQNEQPVSGNDIAYVANQAFFFLKDIGHKHQHHHQSSDTITELGKLDKRHSWITQTHYRIHRKIIELRRSQNPKKLYNASGILAYLNSLKAAVNFTSISKTRGPLSYNHAEIEQSLKSSLEVLKWRQTQLNIIKTALPALSLAALSVMGYQEGSPGATLRDLLNALVGSGSARWFTVALIAGLIAPFYYGVWRVSELPLVVNAKRILVNIPKQTQSLAWFGGFALFFSLAIWQQPLVLFLQRQLSTIGFDTSGEFVSWATVAISTSVTYGAISLLPMLVTGQHLIRRVGEILKGNSSSTIAAS